MAVSHTPSDSHAYTGAVIGALLGLPLGAVGLGVLVITIAGGGAAMFTAVAPGGGLIGLYLGGLVGFAIATSETES
jgi:hypothetical protein